MQSDKQTIEPPTAPPFLKNDEQTKQAGFQNISKALAHSPQKSKIQKNSSLSRILSAHINPLPKILARNRSAPHPQQKTPPYGRGFRISILSRQPYGATTMYFAAIATSRIATMFAILMSGFTAGPAVSLYGSPTVSPVTAAW